MKNLFINGENLTHNSGYNIVYLGGITQEDGNVLHFGEFKGKVIDLGDLSQYNPVSIRGYNFKDEKDEVQPHWDELEDIRPFLGTGDVLVFTLKDGNRDFYAIFNSWDFRDFESEWKKIQDYNKEVYLMDTDIGTLPFTPKNKDLDVHLYFMPIPEETAFKIVNEEEEERNHVVGVKGNLIIHPGDTLKEIMENEGLTPYKLAPMTKMSEEYIQKVMDGQEDITLQFADNLEEAIGIHHDFWNNLQDHYEKEMEALRNFKEKRGKKI